MKQRVVVIGLIKLSYKCYNRYMAIQQEQKLMQTIKMLEERLAKIEKWMEQKKIQQITFPLDQSSQNIINNI